VFALQTSHSHSSKQSKNILLEILVQNHVFGIFYHSCRDGKSRCYALGEADVKFLDATASFLQACDTDQVRMDPQRFAAVCSAFRTHGVALNRPKRCILPLRAAIEALHAGPGSIAPAHADLFQVCLLSKCYPAADPFLGFDGPLTVDPTKTGVAATDVLLYCYYGGMLEIGHRRYSRAMELFLTALTAPTHVMNAITVACLKKYILVALLHLGSVPSLPKYAPQPVMRAYKTDCAAYTELSKLATAVSSGVSTATAGASANGALGEGSRGVLSNNNAGGDIAGSSSKKGGPYDGEMAALERFAMSRSDVWLADNNAGLVKLVLDCARRRRIEALTRTYSSLPLVRLAALTGLPHQDAVEAEVLRMVDEGRMFGRISCRDGMVAFAFGDEPEGFASSLTAARMHRLVADCMALSAAIADVDHSVSCDRAYLSKVETRRGGGGGVEGAGGGALEGGGGSGMGGLEALLGSVGDMETLVGDEFVGGMQG
jgi:COP9 signalosome complex subunit 3